MEYTQQRQFSVIDFGIKISDFKSVQKITFSAPFPLSVNDIIDLSHYLKHEESQLIFSDLKYKFEEETNKYSSINNGNEKIVFLPIKHNTGNKKYYDNVIPNQNDSDNFHITIDVKKYLHIPGDTTAIYFRFRIKSNQITQTMLRKLKDKNYYLESAFLERQTIDIKFNDARNIDSAESSRIEGFKFHFAKFRSVHLFLMVPSSYEVTIWDNFSDCRQLENGWGNYLQTSEPIDDIIVYHWQKKDTISNQLDKFTQLIKIEYKYTNLKLIILYCLVVIVLGAFGSGLASFFSNLF